MSDSSSCVRVVWLGPLDTRLPAIKPYLGGPHGGKVVCHHCFHQFREHGWIPEDPETGESSVGRVICPGSIFILSDDLDMSSIDAYTIIPTGYIEKFLSSEDLARFGLFTQHYI